MAAEKKKRKMKKGLLEFVFGMISFSLLLNML